MTVPNIGFDIDGVVANVYPIWLSFIASKYNVIAPSLEEIRGYDIHKYFAEPLTSNQIGCLLPDVFKQINIIEPYYDSVQFIKWYSTHYLEDQCIYFVTARRETEAQEFTEKWMRKWLTNVKFQIIHCRKSEKSKFIKQNLDAFVEDNYIVANSISKCKPCFLVDRPWNRDYPFYGKNQHRISCLSAIKPWITDFIAKEK